VSPPWPRHHADAIVLSNLDSDVAILTLWSDAGKIASALDPASFAACGNLYSAAGVAFLARNLLSNPRIRHLVLCGVDATGSADAVRALFDSSGQGERPMSAGLPETGLEALRRGVTLIDMAGIADPGRIAARISALPRLPAWGEPLELAAPDVTSGALVSEPAGFVVQHANAARCWVQLVKLTREFGTPVQRPRRASQLLAVTAVLGGEPPEEERARWFAGEAAADVQLAGRPRRRRLVRAPRGGHLDVIASYRLLDLMREWPLALRQVRREHAQLAVAAGLERGALVLMHARVLLADRDLPFADWLLARRYPRTLPWQSDPRGLFLIRLDGDTIRVEHGSKAGPTGRSWEGLSAEQLLGSILNQHLVALPEHAAYLGRELQRAELAARLGLPYRQDAPLDWARIRRSGVGS
jgi:hypothetical protein